MGSAEPSESSVSEELIQRLVGVSEVGIELLEVATAVVLVGLLLIGVFDLVVRIVESIISGEAAEIENVVAFIDTVLLLLIIAEVFRTVIAFAREQSVVRVIVDAALVAVARKIISFRPDTYASSQEALVSAVVIAVLFLTVIIGFFVIRRTLPDPEGPMPAAGTADQDDDDVASGEPSETPSREP